MNKRIVLRAGAAGFILLLDAGASRAQDNPAPKDSAKPTPALSLSAVSNPGKRAMWQERLTLGPGDVSDTRRDVFSEALRRVGAP